jgi:integrase
MDRSVENGFELYCARHTATTRMLQEGLSLAEVGAITGHSDREMVLYYSHITPETQARTSEKIEAIEARRHSRTGGKADSINSGNAK